MPQVILSLNDTLVTEVSFGPLTSASYETVTKASEACLRTSSSIVLTSCAKAVAEKISDRRVADMKVAFTKVLFYEMREDLVKFVEGAHKHLTRLRTFLRSHYAGTFELIHHSSCPCISHAHLSLKVRSRTSLRSNHHTGSFFKEGSSLSISMLPPLVSPS